MDLIEQHKRDELRDTWNTAAAAHQAGHLTEREQREQQELALAEWNACQAGH